MPEKIEKDAFTAVAALSGWCKPVYVQEDLITPFLTYEAVL